MLQLDDWAYRKLFEISEKAIEYARIYLKEDKKRYADMRSFILATTHQQKRRARKGLTDPFFKSKLSLLQSCIEENRYQLERIWHIFIGQDVGNEAILLINDCAEKGKNEIAEILKESEG